jgi:hypothetical protein
LGFFFGFAAAAAAAAVVLQEELLQFARVMLLQYQLVQEEEAGTGDDGDKW